MVGVALFSAETHPAATPRLRPRPSSVRWLIIPPMSNVAARAHLVALVFTALSCGSPGAGSTTGPSYDQIILADHPVAYWAMRMVMGGEPDLTGNGHPGTYQGVLPIG